MGAFLTRFEDWSQYVYSLACSDYCSSALLTIVVCLSCLIYALWELVSIDEWLCEYKGWILVSCDVIGWNEGTVCMFNSLRLDFV